jgi:hemerythrin-like domain-containing protein
MLPSTQLPPVDLSTVMATSILTAEHRVILQVLDVLGELARRAVADQGIPMPQTLRALEVLRTFADACHHAKEELVLFPVLESLQPGFGPTHCMRAEHSTGRAHIAAMAAAIDRGDAQRFAVEAQDYIQFLRQHIRTDDESLFGLARLVLRPREDGEILEGFRRIEHRQLGDGVHVRMLAMADVLATRYSIPCASADPQVMNLLTAACGCAQDGEAPQ